MELDPVDQSAVVDRPRVSGSVMECLPVCLAGGAYIVVGHGGERQKFKGANLETTPAVG
jgi:hypothetical protein